MSILAQTGRPESANRGGFEEEGRTVINFAQRIQIQARDMH